METQNNLYQVVFDCLMCADPFAKVQQMHALYERRDSLTRERGVAEVRRIETPGIPEHPQLIDPKKMRRRGFGSEAGRIALLHALAHIEFNAINLALDAVYRFRDMPPDYADDWLLVANDEARHFMLLSDRLADLGSYYGALSAHAGLWNMALKTDHDVTVRMALVPRVLEARGLDVAPPMIDKLRKHDDAASADILEIIFNDEIQHVSIGNRWFRYTCDQRGWDTSQVFRDLLQQQARGYLRSPYNEVARVQAGFTLDELDALKEIEAAWQDD